MKTAIYIEDGIVQLVLTPQNDWEKNALRSFEGGRPKAEIFTGSFYDCRGGWTRQADYYPNAYTKEREGDVSLIIRVQQDLPAQSSETVSGEYGLRFL